MLATLATRRWMTWLLVATIWATACVFLGRWQFHRWEEKSAAQSRIDRNYDGAPRALGSIMSASKPPARADEWSQVSLKGKYVGSTLMVRNRPGPDGDFGYEVLNVFASGDERVLVDRGWVPNGASARTPSSTPAPPAGDLTLTGWVRPSERSLGRADVAGQVSSVSVKDAERATGNDLNEGYLRLRTEKRADGSTPPRPAALERPSQGQAAGINLSYAIQWWLGILAGYGFVLMRARREYLDSLDGTEQARRAPKPRKTRIWDEEDA